MKKNIQTKAGPRPMTADGDKTCRQNSSSLQKFKEITRPQTAIPISGSRNQISYEKHIQRLRGKNNSNVDIPPKIDGKNESENNPLGELFKMLPPHLLTTRIFSSLDFPEKLGARTVAKAWPPLVNPLLKWNVRLNDGNVRQVMEFFRSLNSPSSLTIQELYNFRYPSKGLCGSSCKTQVLRFAPMPNSQGVKSSNLETILKDFGPQLKKLELGSQCFLRRGCEGDVKLVKSFKSLSELTVLVLTTTKSDRLGHKLISYLLTFGVKSFPKLVHFQITVNYELPIYLEKSAEPPPLYAETYAFAAAQSKTIKKLVINHSGNLVPGAKYSLDLREIDHGVDFDEINAKIQNLAGKLREFVLVPSLYEGSSPRHLLGLKVINFGNNLVVLKVAQINEYNAEVWAALKRLFFKGSGTLKNILVAGSVPKDERLLCGVFSSFGQLEELRLHLSRLRLFELDQLPPSIKILDLGPHLSYGQIRTIGQHALGLEKLFLLQLDYDVVSNVASVDSELLEMLVGSLRKLKVVVVCKNKCNWVDIEELIENSQGALEGRENCEAGLGKEHVGIWIDREKLTEDIWDWNW